MIKVKISGRGGQGAVLASQILANALFGKGMWVQAFPSFGAERRGAPVSAFIRADSDEITLRCGIQHPDWIVLFDPQLLENPLIMGGATEKTSILLNSSRRSPFHEASRFGKMFRVDATAIAEGLNLKTTSFSIVNTAMLGAFARASNLIDMVSVAQAIRDLTPIKKEENVVAAKEAYEKVKEISG
ncbi:MAG: 2-oxoacid:acceptor oxidoreductase family protein [Deltaproteobacteria bacterium]|jgi:2-oxoacid:acceptor oxidoreductase gamma subunit (pyruvate/2-ketoisovalerate family)|nr:2-oxoacid:acceptor oxidoreductase family protein [Deltaproteobacteria bacterium]